MKRLYLLGHCSLFLILHATSQILPDSLRVDWSTSGYTGNIPQPKLIINVKDFGAHGDGVHDDYSAIMSAINSANSLRVIYFPAGNYLIQTTLSLPGNVVLRGEGKATNLQFNLTKGNCIDVNNKQNTAFTAIDRGYTKGSSKLVI